MDYAAGYGLLLTLIAGGATGALAYLTRDKRNLLSAALGFSAGVMIYIVHGASPPRPGLIDGCLTECREALLRSSAFSGMMLIAASTSSFRHMRTLMKPDWSRRWNMQMKPQAASPRPAHGGTIGIHNFPEGIATFFAAMTDPALAFRSRLPSRSQYSGRDFDLDPDILCYRESSQGLLVLISLRIVEPIGALIGFLALRPF